MEGKPATWTERFDELTGAHPGGLALTTTGEAGEALTWSEMTGRSIGVAEMFARRGLEPGGVVCIELPNCLAHVLASLAAWRLGGTVLPLRWDFPVAERARLIELAQPSLVVSARPAGGGRTVTEHEILHRPALGSSLLPRPIAADPAWLIASGGSTGSPKLISFPTTTAIQPGATFSASTTRFADSREHRHPVHLVCAPLYHTHAFALLYQTMLSDYRNVVMPRFDVETALDLIEQQQVAFTALVPTMLIRLLRSPTIRTRDFSSIECVLQGAGACPEWVIREWIDLVGPERFLMGYGSTEGVCSALIRGDEWLRKPGSVGRPVNSEVLVVGQDGDLLPPGEVGELFFRPADDAPRFRYIGQSAIRTLPGGYISIGDLGRVDGEGYLYIADRRTDMVVTGGANVFVSEVEAVLVAHPDVDDAVVIGLRDPEWGRRVHGILQLRAGADREGIFSSIRAHCKERLAGYKVPRTFEIVDDIDRSEAGKINRQAMAKDREERESG